jgi:hypothetical protein
MKTTAPLAIPPALIRRLDKLLAAQGGNLIEFLTHTVKELETCHKDPAWQAAFIDPKRDDGDLAASRSPRDYMRRVGKWAPAAYRAWQKRGSPFSN